LGVSDKRGDSANVIYRYTQNSLEEVNLLLAAPVGKGLDVTAGFKKDLLNQRNIERTYGFAYKRQCWNVIFNYKERNVLDTNGVDRTDDKTYEFKFAIYGL